MLMLLVVKFNNKTIENNIKVQKSVLQPFLDIRGFEIRGFSFPPTSREFRGSPVAANARLLDFFCK